MRIQNRTMNTGDYDATEEAKTYQDSDKIDATRRRLQEQYARETRKAKRAAEQAG